ncbi:hypothetical protein [Bacillus sp. MZGC1]|uniref:hypothetical protein n=1 Tax=Bacillus sp. MZGC1 TaxID=2108543 RepID=UPI000D02FCD6|nr:hypothetical protein [Bacillus sp. MZGC1]PRS48135.1 hypothetical protein C6Y06_17920 [Bacillus sp. MZGC1]
MILIAIIYYILTTLIKFCLVRWARKNGWGHDKTSWAVIFVPLIGLGYLVIMCGIVIQLKNSK